MGRKKKSIQRPILPDVRYGNLDVSRFINKFMWDGKKSTAERTFYGAMDIIKDKMNLDPMEVFTKALDNAKPDIEVRSRRVGGATYQVPVEVRTSRRITLAIRWLVTYSRARAGKSMAEKIAGEVMDCYKNTGATIKKREDTHRMAEANRAFAHFKW